MGLFLQLVVAVAALLLSYVQGAAWPTVTISSPTSGVLLIGEGRSESITFEVQGEPFPRIRKWYKDGVEISSANNIVIDESGGNLQKLKFNSITRGNEGTYYLVVANDVTLDSTKSPEVIVKVSYLDDTWDSSSQTVTATVGGFAVLECRPPKHFGSYIKFSWKKNNVLIEESERSYISEYGNLVLLQVATDDYSPNYRCTITIDTLSQGDQTKEGGPVTLNVQQETVTYKVPEIALRPVALTIDAQIKETFLVECVANGYPNLPTIRWYKDGSAITSSGPIYDIQTRNYIRITIPRSGGNVGGLYRCDATDNKGQSTYATAQIDIYTKPVITTGLPTSEVKKSSGSELSLACAATSSPSSSFKWYKNAVLLKNGINTKVDNGILLVSNLNTLNRGVYQCEAYNDVGSTISTGKVTVQERLTFVIRPEDVEVFLGTAATFNCMGKGNPGPTSLQWQFNGADPPSTHEYTNKITNQATYKIPKVTSSDAGKISCVISSPENLYPTDVATAILTIRQGPQVIAHVKEITVTEGSSADLVCKVENAENVDWKWLFKGTLVTQPDDQRITISPGLLQIRSMTAVDQGEYTCQADENGLSNHDTITITVETYPKVVTDETKRIGEGLTAELTCTVTSNPESAITWKRDGNTIQETDVYKIDNSVAGSSTLSVVGVSKTTHVGKYMCSATNKVGTGTSEVDLVVVAQCEVMDTPKDAVLDYEGETLLTCSVNQCSQTPIWTWKKDGTVVEFDNFRYINMGQGTIKVKRAMPTMAGVYTCEVTGTTIDVQTYSATIKIEVKAKITKFGSYPVYSGNRVLFKEGDSVEMTCEARGDYSMAPLNINWYKSGVLQYARESSTSDTKENIMYMTAILGIAAARAADAGHYQCTVQNNYNEDKRDTSLMLMTQPDRPGQPYDTWIGAGAMELSWGEPANTGNTNLTSYEIHIESNGNSVFRPFMQGLSPNQVTQVMYFLSENQEYKFKVIAANVVGKSEASDASSEIQTFRNQDSPTLNLVTEFSLTTLNSDSIRVTWTEPNQRTNSLQGFVIVYRNEDRLEAPRFNNTFKYDYTARTVVLTGLNAGSKYSVQIQSNTQTTTNLLVSSVKWANTLNQRPSEPLGCEADRESSSSIVVAWQTPLDSHGMILSYNLYYRPRGDDGDYKVLNNLDPQTTTYALTLIDSNSDYDVEVAASNSAGEGTRTGCVSIGKTINKAIFEEWWFYLILALVVLILVAAIILCALLIYKRRSKEPRITKMPPPMQKNNFAGPNAHIMSPNMARPPTYPTNTFHGTGGAAPYSPPSNPNSWGGAAGFMTQPKSPDFGTAPRNDGYNYNKFNTFDSRASYNDPPKSPYDAGRFDRPSYEAPKYEPPKSPYDAGRFENPKSPSSNYGGRYGGGGDPYNDNNTVDSRYNRDPYGAPSYNGGGGGGFKSSKL